MLIEAKHFWRDSSSAQPGQILLENGTVRAVGAQLGTPDIRCAYMGPGLFDQHIHGSNGVNVMTAHADGMMSWLEQLAQGGTAAVLPTLYTAPTPRMRAALETVAHVMRLQRAGAGGARVLGVHLEGPYISPQYLGTMDPKYLQPTTIEGYDQMVNGLEDIVRLVTLAPEQPGADELTRRLTARGIRVMAGHTAAGAEEGVAAFEAGVSGICHFFNAAIPIHHRKPGILTSALLDKRIYAECISDMVHVHPYAVRLLYQVKGPRRMILISDGVATTGLADGEYINCEETVLVRNGQSRSPEGNLTGGTYPLAGCVRAAAAHGIPVLDALRMASITPRRFLGLRGSGAQPGESALMTCLNAQLEPVLTVVGPRTYPTA